MSKNPQNLSKNSSPLLKKVKLYEMALDGKPRPKPKNKSLRASLAKYADHDPQFKDFIKNLRPHWFHKTANGDRKPIPSFELVIQRMLNARRNPQNPALKAHATRALRSYAASRATEIGSTPERVVAGVRAAVTKRMAKD